MTLRQLLLLAEGASKDRWSHTSNLLALIANCNRDPKKSKTFKSSDFDPHTQKNKRSDAIEVTSENIGILKNAFSNF